MELGNSNSELDRLLNLISERIDLNETRYKEAEARYKAIAEWLGSEGSALESLEPEIYPQGSFLLGTATRPTSPDEEFDIDLVCQLLLDASATTPSELKHMVGDRLKENAVYRRMLEEKDRCWRLNYAGEFHLDVLPSIPDQAGGSESILVPDKALRKWITSNPKGYGEWFLERMRDQYDRRRTELAAKAQKDPEQVPHFLVKTPLQRAIQLIKRNRDIDFASNPDMKPASIVVTTLAAQAYSNQDGLEPALLSIVNEMPDFIEERNGQAWIANPTNTDENFADKWRREPERGVEFYRWVSTLAEKLERLNGLTDKQDLIDALEALFAESLATEDKGRAVGVLLNGDRTTRGESGIRAFDIAHKQPPPWRIEEGYSVEIRAIRKAGTMKGVMPRPFGSNQSILDKGLSLEFSAFTNAPRPVSIEWQVVNTGEEAKLAGQLRGDFYPSSGRQNGAHVRKESTLYTGSHWVEAFVIKDGICIARSGEFVVRIK